MVQKLPSICKTGNVLEIFHLQDLLSAKTHLDAAKCWNIVTLKNILYVSFVVPDGPTGRTTCITLYSNAPNQKN